MIRFTCAAVVSVAATPAYAADTWLRCSVFHEFTGKTSVQYPVIRNGNIVLLYNPGLGSLGVAKGRDKTVTMDYAINKESIRYWMFDRINNTRSMQTISRKSNDFIVEVNQGGQAFSGRGTCLRVAPQPLG